MFNVFTKESIWGGKPLILETGKMARQADGAVLVRYGNTAVLTTVVSSKKMTPTQDFFPLSVHYQEKVYAAGKIPGGFFKREGRPSEKDVLTSRLIDRPIRPLFPKEFNNETQVVCTVLSFDQEFDAVLAAMVGTSAALAVSGIPFFGPIGAARVGYVDGHYILNPTPAELENSELDLLVAGTSEGVLMVESEAGELSEEVMLEAIKFGHTGFQPVIEAVCSFAEDAAKEPWDLPEVPSWHAALKTAVLSFSKDMIADAYNFQEKKIRRQKLDDIHEIVVAEFFDFNEGVTAAILRDIVHSAERAHVRGNMLLTKSRLDGRDPEAVRPIVCETGLLDRAHGSALFTRGETQALAVATLGTGDDAQLIDAMEGAYKEDFMLHYNFPPFSVGEAGRLGSPGRREIGHGKLAWRAITPVLPAKEDFPYTIRVVSEVLESNGSSSMATVCSASLSLMDVGVPIPGHVAGIAMGLIKEKDDFIVLSDIIADEDHLGDMDFKVAGTTEGITALQMDIKITSINESIMSQALAQAKHGRLHIIREMNQAMTASRESLNKNAPQMERMTINPDKIREVIGSGGKIIRELCETTGAKIDIEDDGNIFISGPDSASVDAARKRIESIVAVPEEGRVYNGEVVKIVEFGAFVDFLNSSGLVHISEMKEGRVERSSDVVKMGDKIKVKVIGFDKRGKVRLSMKQVGSTEELA